MKKKGDMEKDKKKEKKKIQTKEGDEGNMVEKNKRN